MPPYRILLAEDSLSQVKVRCRTILEILESSGLIIQDAKEIAKHINLADHCYQISGENVEICITDNAIEACHQFSKSIEEAQPFNAIITDYEMSYPSDPSQNGNGDVLINFIRNFIKSNHELSDDSRIVSTKYVIPDVMMVSSLKSHEIEKDLKNKCISEESQEIVSDFFQQDHPYLTVEYQEKNDIIKSAIESFIQKSATRFLRPTEILEDSSQTPSPIIGAESIVIRLEHSEEKTR